MYHRLNRVDPSTSLTISPESFSRQVDWLERKSFQFLSLDEVVKRPKANLGERVVALTFDDGFRDNYENGFSLLVRRRKSAALFLVVDWIGQKDFVSWSEIRELADSGITMGSHSLSHRWLPNIMDERELDDEILGSKKIIEDRLGREVRHFCYPVGGVDERVAERVKRAGYMAAWVAGAKPSVAISEPLLCLRRIKVGRRDSSIIRFMVKAYGFKPFAIGN